MKNYQMDLKRTLLILSLIIVPVSSDAVAQVAELSAQGFELSPTFYFDAISYASEEPGRARLDIYIQVPYQELRFVRENDNFVARYDITFTVSTASQQLVHERAWTEVIRTSDFSQTISSRFYSLSHRAIEIDPGNYLLSVLFREEESRKSARQRRSLLVTDYSKDSLSLSDIMLVSRLSTDGERRTIVPNVSGNVGHLTEGFFLFFEVYNSTPRDTVELLMQVYDANRRVIFTRSQPEPITGKVTQSFLKVDPLSLAAGAYLLTVEARDPSATAPNEKVLAQTSRTFRVLWVDLPATIQDLDKAIDQMRYVARPSEMDYIRDATTPEEKRRRFLEFWKKRDPDPRTPRNEILEEYYARVEYANKNFGSYIDGWRSDRGMVYIHLGPPEHIERRPFDMGSKPYEIWYYYQLNRDFVFVDETGFGDYRLRTPMVDFLGRIR